jgi:hypothetical protein
MNTRTHLAAANAADVDRFLESVNMANGAYTLDNNTTGTEGARHVTVTHTSGDTTDTLGTVAIVGTDLAGQAITETITPSADATVTGAKWFKTVTSATQAGWVIDAVEVTNDTITIGMSEAICVLEGVGVLETIIVNTTAASTIVVADSGGTIATLKASIAEGHYVYGLDVSNLTIDLNGASDVTIVHTPSLPTSYALA